MKHRWWSEEPSFESLGDLPGTVLPIRDAVFLVPVDELRPWKLAAAFLIGVNAALVAAQLGTIWMLWRTT